DAPSLEIHCRSKATELTALLLEIKHAEPDVSRGGGRGLGLCDGGIAVRDSNQGEVVGEGAGAGAGEGAGEESRAWRTRACVRSLSSARSSSTPFECGGGSSDRLWTVIDVALLPRAAANFRTISKPKLAIRSERRVLAARVRTPTRLCGDGSRS